MNRLDLIIDALNSFTQRTVDIKSGTRRMCCGDPIEEKHTQHCIGLKALAAARELKALEPVAWVVRRTTSEGIMVDGVWTCDSDEEGAIPVYALDDGVKHD